MAIQQFEPMSIGGILDKTFTIYRENFVRFVAIAAVVYVPIGLLTAVSATLTAGGFTQDTELMAPSADLSESMETAMVDSDAGGGLAIAGVVGFLIAMLLGIVGKVLASGALLRSVSEYYLGNDVSVGEAYQYVLPKIGTLIWAGFLVGLVTALGFLLLIVPGIIFGLWFALVTPAIIVEGLAASQGMSRSKALASGNLGKIFSTLFVAGIISAIIAGIVTWAGGFLGAAMFATGPGSWFVSQFTQVLGEVLAAPIWAVAVVLLYYDLRIRKEGFDLEMMARELALPAGQAGTGPQGQDV